MKKTTIILLCAVTVLTAACTDNKTKNETTVMNN